MTGKASADTDTGQSSPGHPAALEFTWQTVRATYIVPLLSTPGHGEPVRQSDPHRKDEWRRIERANVRGGGKGLLSATVEAEGKRQTSGGSAFSEYLLGKPMAQALGYGERTSLATREEWVGTINCPPNVADWKAERISFRIGNRVSKFLVVGLDIQAGKDLEEFLVQSKEGRRADAPGALTAIFQQVEPSLRLRGDGGLFPPEGADSLAADSRLYISTVTMAIPSGPGDPPALQSLRNFENWGDAEHTSRQKWSYFLATHNRHNRRLPPDSKEYAETGFLHRAGAYDVRVEPFGTSVIFTDDIPDAWWDQLKVLRSGANPFVELALLSYWQHACLEYFTDELAKQGRLMENDRPDLKNSLMALRDFGDSYFYFRNCIWFDNVPNKPEWTEYLQRLQMSLGDREAFARLASDYNDWTSHLGNRVALEEEERRTRNENQVRAYSGLVGVSGLALALAAIVFEPATLPAIWAGSGLLAAISLWSLRVRTGLKKSPKTAISRT